MSDSFQERMNRLAQRVSRELDGESLLDVATALFGLIAFAICESSSSIDERQRFLNTLVVFMRKQIRNGDQLRSWK
jgi:hypothetical protein